MAPRDCMGILVVLVCVTRCAAFEKYDVHIESDVDDDTEEKYRIGVISDRMEWTFELRATLEVALGAANELGTDYKMAGRLESLSQQDALEAGQDAWKLMGITNMVGVVAPFNRDSLRHVQAATDLLDVALLITQPVDTDIRTWTAINLYPHYSVITEVVMGMIVQKGWTRFTVVFEEPEALERLSRILKENSKATPYYITTRQLPLGENYRSLLLNLKGSNAENLIVDCKLESSRRLLEQAQEVGIVSEPYSYIFTHLDLQTLDLERYSYGGANITAFRMFDVSSPMVLNFTRRLNEEYENYFLREKTSMPSAHEEFTPESLASVLPLTYDAVQLQAAALRELKVLKSLSYLDRDEREGLEFGSTIINHMRTMIMKGLTGTIKFDEDGDRSEIFLEILELTEGGVLTAVGNWSSFGINIKERKGGEPALIIEHPPEDIPPDDSDSMKDKHFIVLISLTDPYGMRRESTEMLQGNDRFEGFCVELIEELAQILGFKYTFEIQEDGQSGSFNATTKQWDGMLGRVINGTADFAITDLTITAEREAAVDFTTPFMNLGISILFKKPKEPGANPFSFLLPFSNGVWFGLGAAYLGCSALLYILGRLCPEEWQNPFPCVEEPSLLENQFTLANALWFNLGAVLLQGSEIAPVAYGTRAAASMWWFFALIITSSYTANLASLLSITQKFEPIHEAVDLINNTYNISYGAKLRGSTYSFFKDSGDPIYHQMYEYMEKNPWNMANRNDNATARVLEGDYAFLMESTTIEYLVERQCGLTQVGKLLDNKGYGLAMKKMSVYRQKMNLALLNLLEQGKLASIKKKWWKEKRGGGGCVEEPEESMELALMNVGGVFLVLVVGCFLGLAVSFLDMTWHVFRRARMLQVPFIPEFKREIKFVFDFKMNEKPLRHQRSDSSSGSQRALTLQSLRTSPARDSFSLTPEESSLGTRSPEKRHSGHAPSRRASGRSARRRSTMHEGSVRLARQTTKE